MTTRSRNVAIAEALQGNGIDTVSLRSGVFTARRSFFYRHGGSSDNLAAIVQRAVPNADIIDHGEIWKPFRGGASVAQGSHWFVKFTVD